MNLTIPEAIISETSKCEHDFSCLKSGQQVKRPICPVDYANGRNVIFLKTDEPIPCHYQIPFGYGMVCRCPTHFELHKKGREQKTPPAPISETKR